MIFKSFLNPIDNGVLSSNCDVEIIRIELRRKFENNENLVLDFEGVTAISPSFAYECFGQVYSDKTKLSNVLSRLTIINDDLNFYEKIRKAIERRIMVLS